MVSVRKKQRGWCDHKECPSLSREHHWGRQPGLGAQSGNKVRRAPCRGSGVLGGRAWLVRQAVHKKATWPVVAKPKGGEGGTPMRQVVAAARGLGHKWGDRSMHTGGWTFAVFGVLESRRGEEGTPAERPRCRVQEFKRCACLMRNRKFTQPQELSHKIHINYTGKNNLTVEKLNRHPLYQLFKVNNTKNGTNQSQVPFGGMHLEENSIIFVDILAQNT